LRSVLQVFEPDRGGVPAHVEQLARGLAGRGWQVTVAGPPGAAAVGRLAATEGIDVAPLELAHRPDLSDIAAARALVGLCRARPSIVHAHSTKAGLLAAAASHVTHLPTVYTPHAWVFERARSAPMRALAASYERALAGSYRAIVAVAASEKRRALSHRVAPAGVIHVIPNGIEPNPTGLDRATARAGVRLDPAAFVACWVGRDARQKRPQDLPRLAHRLSHDGITLAVLGDGLRGSRRETAIVRSGGVVLDSETDPSTLYAAADVLVSTSAWEGHPLCVLEAMRAGLPVVAYAVGGIPEQIDNLRTGYLVVPGSVDELARRVVGLRDDDPGRARMGAAAAARFGECFTAERMIDRVEALYATVGFP
jgi:glycosyltransferase involved in cell wall biosynthesis